MGLLGKIWVKLGLDNSEFKKGIKGAQTESNVFAQGFKKIGGMIAGAFAIESIVRFGKELLDLRDKSKGIESAFKAINKPTLLSELRAATGGAVSDLKLMQNAVKANNFKIPMEELATYMKFASQRALETGESVDYLVESIILGLSRESVMILDNLGLSAVGIRKEMENGGTMAKAVGKMIQEEFKKSNTVLDESISKSAKLAASWENFKKMVAQGFVGEAVSGFGVMLQGQMDAFSWLFGGKRKAKTELFNKEDNERAKKWLSNIKDINHAKFELSKLDGKVLSTAETMYVQMLKEYVQKEENAALQKKISAETIDGINKEIESFEILKKAELDPEKKQYYVDEIARLNKKLSIMEMTTDELKKQRKEQEIAAAELVKGTIPYQEKKIKLLQEDIALTTDTKKRAALNQELANAEHRLAVMKLTTDELREYNMLVARDIRAGGEIPYVSARPKGKIAPLNLDKEGKKIDPILSYRNRFQSGSLPDLEAQLKRYKDLYNRIDATPAQKQFFKEQIDGLEDGIKGLSDGMKDFNKEFNEEVLRSANIAANFGQAVAQSMSDSMKQIFDAISSGEKIDASAMTKAILMPFADMAVQIGEVMVATGAAALAAKAIGKVGGPGAAIAAGAVLMALGAAAQSQIGRIGSSFGAGSSSDPYSYTGGAAVSNVSNQPIQVYGVLKGQDIYLSSEKYKQNKSR